MRYSWDTGGKPKLLNVFVDSPQPQDILIKVEDADKPGTYYSKQETTLDKGVNQFELSLPFTPQKAFFEIAPVNGNGLPWGIGGMPSLNFNVEEKPFKAVDCSVISGNEKLQKFLRFASWLAKNKNVLPAEFNDDSTLYISPCGQFKVRYVPEIIDDEPFTLNESGDMVMNELYGAALPTSFRVHTITTDMEFSQRYAWTYTTTEVMALFTHEFSHVFLNKDPDSEKEADRNSVIVCRGLGFSKREIGNAYAKVFLRYPSDENVERIYAIKKLLEKID